MGSFGRTQSFNKSVSFHIRRAEVMSPCQCAHTLARSVLEGIHFSSSFSSFFLSGLYHSFAILLSFGPIADASLISLSFFPSLTFVRSLARSFVRLQSASLHHSRPPCCLGWFPRSSLRPLSYETLPPLLSLPPLPSLPSLLLLFPSFHESAGL